MKAALRPLGRLFVGLLFVVVAFEIDDAAFRHFNHPRREGGNEFAIVTYE